MVWCTPAVTAHGCVKMGRADLLLSTQALHNRILNLAKQCNFDTSSINFTPGLSTSTHAHTHTHTHTHHRHVEHQFQSRPIYPITAISTTPLPAGAFRPLKQFLITYKDEHHRLVASTDTLSPLYFRVPSRQEPPTSTAHTLSHTQPWPTRWSGCQNDD